MLKTQPIPPALRSAFEADLAGERIRSMREICVLAAVLYGAFAILDIWAIPSALHTVWLIRASVIAFGIGTFVATRYSLFLNHYPFFAVGMVLLAGFGIEVMVYLAGPGELARYLYCTGMILVVMGLYTWTFIPIWQQVATGMTLVVVYVLIALFPQQMSRPDEWPVLVANSFFFISANILGAYGAFHRNRYLRESFLLRQNLISDLERTEAEKRHSQFWSEHDPLTRLPNRKNLMPRLEAGIQAAREAGRTVALLFIDLDGFKAINDQLGHAAGDDVLKVVGERLRACVREGDLVARYGGDEFVVVLEVDPADLEAAEGLARSIIDGLEQPIREVAGRHSLSASIGIAYLADDHSDAETLLQRADENMYASKRAGKAMVASTASRYASDPSAR